ncbi:iron dicitrate transporter FecR [Pseudomonas laurentiana]|nr:iron dicitrate transporter FecR [Pseudomonas laurentiana]
MQQVPPSRAPIPVLEPRTEAPAVVCDRPKDPVWEMALDWLLRMQEQPGDPVLHRRLHTWLEASPAHLRAYRKAEKVWRMSGQLMNSPLLDCSLPAPANPPRARRHWLRRRVVSSAVAACAMLLVLPDWQGITADYSSPVGEHRQVTLADGSVVELDSGSAIDVQFSADKRQVTLLRGHAFFSVQPQPQRVFQVAAEAITVTVTGTAFAVELSPDTVDVSVANGSVNVADQRRHDATLEPLKPGQRISFLRQGEGVQRAPIPVDQIAAWRQWQLVVIDQPVSDIVARLRAYQPGLIVLNDDALGKRRITAALDLRSPQQALRAAIAPLGGQVKTLSPYVLRVSGAD